MVERNDLWVRTAASALDRHDHLTAFCYARKAASAPDATPLERCGAYMTLARVSLALDEPEPALAYAVQSHLTACRSGDAAWEERAIRLVTLVAERYPYLRDEGISVEEPT